MRIEYQNINLSGEVAKLLQERAEATGRTLEAYVGQMMTNHHHIVEEHRKGNQFIVRNSKGDTFLVGFLT